MEHELFVHVNPPLLRERASFRADELKTIGKRSRRHCIYFKNLKNFQMTMESVIGGETFVTFRGNRIDVKFISLAVLGLRWAVSSFSFKRAHNWPEYNNSWSNPKIKRITSNRFLYIIRLSTYRFQNDYYALRYLRTDNTFVHDNYASYSLFYSHLTIIYSLLFFMYSADKFNSNSI